MKVGHLRQVVVFAAVFVALTGVSAHRAEASPGSVSIEVFTPQSGGHAGIGGFGWFVDLAINFSDVTLPQTGFSGFQLTGPGVHNNVPPMPGQFKLGHDDRMPGLVVLVSTTKVGAGPGQNVAGLFNLTGVTHAQDQDIELWDTWIVGAPNFGVNTPTTVYVAMVADLNGDGIFNDAPDVVPDSNGDGVIDEKDLEALGLASNVKVVKFFINP